MAPISLAVLVRTVAGKLINIPLASLRRKLVDHNLFNFHEKSIQEMGFDRLLTRSRPGRPRPEETLLQVSIVLVFQL